MNDNAIISLLPPEQQNLFSVDCVNDLLPLYGESHNDVIRLIDLTLSYFLNRPLPKFRSMKKELCYLFEKKSNSYTRLGNIHHAAYLLLNQCGKTFSKLSHIQIFYLNAKARAVKGYDFTRVNNLFQQAHQPWQVHYKTPDTLGLAKEIYETKNFSLMPILADALLDLDCPEEQLIHVREGKGLSNWALFHLRNTNSRDA